MGKTMYADFSDDTFDALMRGDAVDNNGLRSKRGSYYPDQPSFRLKPTAKEQFQDLGVELSVYATRYAVKEILCPAGKRFFNKNIYPVIEKKWNALKTRRPAVEAKEMESQPPIQPQAQKGEDTERSAVVVDLEDYRKMA